MASLSTFQQLWISKHEIKLMTTEPVRSKICPVPIHLQNVFDKEVDSLFEQGIIRQSDSNYRSSPILVKKAVGSYRLALDTRVINSITLFDSDPACNVEDDFHKFSGCIFFGIRYN